MSGHSKWAGIKHKKAIIDAKRGKVWTKIVREITMAAKLQGGSPDNNPRLRKAIDDAKAANMPQENIKRAIQRGTGELPGVNYEDLAFEGYGPGGVAVFCEGTTDNRNRTTNQVRKIYEDFGGNMGASGCVAYLFERKGLIRIKAAGTTEEQLLEIVLELGGEDLKASGDVFEVIAGPAEFEAVRAGLESKGLELETAELTMLPKTTVAVDGDNAVKTLKLVEALEEHDDVADVYANYDIPDSVFESLEAG